MLQYTTSFRVLVACLPVPPNESSGRHWLGWVRRLDFTVVLAAIVALGLLAYVAYVASARGSLTELWRIVQGTWILILLLTFPYLAARAVVWYQLLRQLKIRVSWGEMIVAFAGGEITKSLPAGVYVQNFLLGRLAHLGRLSVVRSTAATTATLGLESFLALPVALIIGVPGVPWLRWVLAGIVAAWLLLLMLVWVAVRYRAHHIGPTTAAWRRRLIEMAEEFLSTGAELVAPRTALYLFPTAIYMLIYVVELHAITHAVGVPISFTDMVGIYAIIVLAVILIPIPTEVGITELTGLGALVAYGVPRASAAVIMLSLRLLSGGMTILVAIVLLVVVRHELRR